MTVKKPRPKPFTRPGNSLFICLLLVIAVGAVYGQTGGFDFVNYDDPAYVTQNPYVQSGLTVTSIAWAFKSTYEATWQPLTWLSFMLGSQLHGLDSGWHHLTNVLFHLANVVLLFLVLRRMTKAIWPSALTAALFALHPIHVESVAWVAERKDVLSAFFWILTMWAYNRYAERPGAARYLFALFFFILGLMAKPMLVTLPFVLVLLDWWPLNRLRFEPSNPGGRPGQIKAALALVYEKAPFFLFAAISGLITFLVQQSGGAVRSLEAIPFGHRVANALVSYMVYLGKLILPINLAVFYPHPGSRPVWQAGAAGLALVIITGLAVTQFRKRPYLTVGWLWYLGTMVPVIGLIQIGLHALADRFAYIPFIGLYIILAWSAAELAADRRYVRMALVSGLAAILAVLAVTAWNQAREWRDTVTLFEHALKVTENNFTAHLNLAYVLMTEQGRTAEAVEHYRQALAQAPAFSPRHRMYNDFGVALARNNRTAEAEEQLRQAVELRPDYAEAYFNLGNVLLDQGRTDSALKYLVKAVELNPQAAGFQARLADVYYLQNDADKAVEHYRRAVALDPEHLPGLYSLAVLSLSSGDDDQARPLFERIIRLDPERAEAYYGLACVYARQNNVDQALLYLKRAVQKNFRDWELVRTDPDLANIRSSPQYQALIRGK